jgi:hypothetical protein
MADMPVMEEAHGMCLSFVWKLSQLSMAFGIWRQGQQQNIDDLCSSGLGNSKQLLAHATMSHGLNCPQACVQLGSGNHQAEQASLHLTVVHQLS